MLYHDGVPVAEAYATAMAKDSPYTVRHNVNMVNVVDEQRVLHLYLMDEHHIHCRMQGEPFPEEDLLDLCGAVSHLPYSLQVCSALLKQDEWLRRAPVPLPNPRGGRPKVDRGYASDRG